jgi:enoyl-[acyl-carrier protein] reductase I
VTIEDIGNVAAGLTDDLWTKVTGDVAYVDGGFRVIA